MKNSALEQSVYQQAAPPLAAFYAALKDGSQETACEWNSGRCWRLGSVMAAAAELVETALKHAGLFQALTHVVMSLHL